MRFLLAPICAATGHKWGHWRRTMLTKTRYCQRCDKMDSRVDRGSMSALRRLMDTEDEDAEGS